MGYASHHCSHMDAITLPSSQSEPGGRALAIVLGIDR